MTKTCGGQTQYNNTYFVNSGYPQTFAGGSRCNMQVTRMGTDVCQLRIDFLDFSLAQPTGDGVCSIDYFTVAGGSSPVPRICGENSGHHVYVDFSGNNPITITVATSGSFTFNRRWHFHLQQIGCDSTSKGLRWWLRNWFKWNYSPPFQRPSVAFSIGWTVRVGLAALITHRAPVACPTPSAFKARDKSPTSTTALAWDPLLVSAA